MLKQVSKLFFQENNLLLLILIILGIFVRFLWLDKIPVGITHDDADVVLSAQSFWQTGMDISGSPFPSSLFFNKTPGKISGLPSVLISPVIGFFGLNLSNIHLIYVFVNLLTILFIVLLVRYFIDDPKVLSLVATAGLFNPWLFAYSRYPTEAPFALLFVVIAIYLIFRQRAWNILFSTLFFVLSFYSYFGAKVAIPVLYPIMLIIRYFQQNKDFKNIKIYLISLAVFVFTVGGYFYVVLNSKESTFSQRASSEFVFSNISLYQSKVDEIRRASIDFPLKKLFFNKYVLLADDVSKRYVGWLSPDFLFVSGDPVSVYHFEEHGVFYLVDLVLLILGIFYIAFKKEKKINFCLAVGIPLLLVAPIGSSISRVGLSYFFRSFLIIPVFITLISFGLDFINSKTTKLIFNLFLLIYLIFFINFLAFYFFRYPVKQQDNQFLEGRILSSYVKRSAALNQKSDIYATDPLSTYHLITFYNGFKNPKLLTFVDQFSDIQDQYLKISAKCMLEANQSLKIYETKLNCPKLGAKYLIIQNQKDAGSQFVIYNDKVCSDMSLDSYRRDHLVSDFSIENMTNQEFCNRWIFKNEK